MKCPLSPTNWVTGLLVVELICAGCGCASQPKDAGSASALSTPVQAPQASTPMMEPQAVTSQNEACSAKEDEDLAKTPSDSARAPQGAAVTVAPAKPVARATSGASAERKRAPAMTSSPKSKSENAAYDSPTLAPEPATPAFAEPPELKAALLEFDAQVEKLSLAKGCEDACRAFASMRRSAQRICDLVVSSDPRQRCRTARDRLDQAARDLASRCAECR